MSETIACIVAAFITDPVARFACPAPHDYLRAMPLVAREFGGRSFERGSAYVSVDFCGAALWLPPGVHPNGAALEKVFRDLADPEHLHWYLPLVGVEPNAQARGLGGGLMLRRPR